MSDIENNQAMEKQKKASRLELPIIEKRLRRTHTPAARKSKTSTRVKMLTRKNKDEPKDQLIDIPTCRCRDLAETLLTMQMFPKTLINVRAAIHFGCLDLLDMFELRAQVSTTVFAEALNQINMFETLLQTFFVVHREDVGGRSKHQVLDKCAACATSDVVSYMVDGCASLKRKKTSNPEIDHYKLQREDSQIKADSGRNMRGDMVNDIIAVICIHAVAKKLIDMKQGERLLFYYFHIFTKLTTSINIEFSHAHTLAALSSIARKKMQTAIRGE
ncbi:hypothetical protein [Parasitella parasitica]|uniref:Uncharacterized protein n=1 Tax=Parasitella parasitica TaxID=35722 RepID=A0A0B7NCR7_9FUNG|nr:hypothetical protein [Parasitella parasitica]